MVAIHDTKTKGEIAETFVLANLIKKGFTVSIPYGENSRYDFIIETRQGFKRIQVKYIAKHKGRSYFTFPLRSVRANKKQNKIKHYTKKEIDFMIGYCTENNSCYIIPLKELRVKHELHIWIDKEPKGKNQFKPMNIKRYKNNWELLNKP